jgi:hypothetical protein
MGVKSRTGLVFYRPLVLDGDSISLLCVEVQYSSLATGHTKVL